MMMISGRAMVASSDPIEMSTSPEMKTMAQPMPAMSASEACPSTLVILRTEKKFSTVKEKNASTRMRQTSNASSCRAKSRASMDGWVFTEAVLAMLIACFLRRAGPDRRERCREAS